ncbi:MAG: AzlC family ABC transporter permease [Cocleimonas sp.]|nr:AzlC family ABC transporter permease [Cocleimonas sp.]
MTNFFAGLRTSLPLIIGYFPVAVAFGISATSIGLSQLDATLISLIIFAGASQFAFVGLLAEGTSGLTAMLIVVGLNLRHLLYSTSISPALKGMSLKQKFSVAFGLTDEVFASAFGLLKNIPKGNRWSWLVGLELGAYCSWVIGTWIGASSGDLLLAKFGFLEPALAFALPALFLSLLLPMLVSAKASHSFIRNRTIITIISAMIIAFGANALGQATLGIFGAALISPLLGIALGKKHE